MYLVFLLALGLGEAFAKEDSKKESTEKVAKSSDKTPKKTTVAPKKSKASVSKPTGKKSNTSSAVRLDGQPQRSNQNVVVYGNVGQEQQPNAHQPLGNRETKPEFHKAPSNVPSQQVGKEDLPTAGTLERPDKPNIKTIPVESSKAPKVTKPQVQTPKASTPKISTPTQSRPQISKPKVTKPQVDRPQVSKPQTSKTSTPHPQVRKPTVTKPQVQTPKASTPKISTPTQSHPQIEKKSHTTPTKVRVERPTEQKPVESQVGAPQKKQPTSHKQPSKSRAPSLTNYENQPAQWTSGFNSGLNDPRRQNGSNSSVNKMDRKGKTSLSISSLSYASGYNSGMDYQDGGLGIALGIRPLKNVGGEISYGQYTDSLFSTDPDRLNRPIQAVAQGFFLPDEMFTPFVSAGYVQNSIYLNDQYSWNGNEEIAKQQSTLTGAVLGAGIEVNLSSSLSLDFDARYLLYTNAPETKPATNNATLTSVGVNFYF